MGLIIHLCGTVNVNAKKIVVVVTVVRLVLEVLVMAGVVATLKKARGGTGEGAPPLPQCKSSIDRRTRRPKDQGPADQRTKGPADQRTRGLGDQRTRGPSKDFLSYFFYWSCYVVLVDSVLFSFDPDASLQPKSDGLYPSGDCLQLILEGRKRSSKLHVHGIRIAAIRLLLNKLWIIGSKRHLQEGLA